MPLDRTFPLDVVLTVTTGFLVCRSFGDAHELFDHLYPGIMTLGIATMGDEAAAEVIRQHPDLADCVITAADFGGEKGDAALAAIAPKLAAWREVYGDSFAIAGGAF
jgi:hypothetical protein